MTTETAIPVGPAACCAPAAQETCCAAADKAACCGAQQTSEGGCGCQ